MHSAKIAIDPYVHGVCGHFAQIGLKDLKVAIELYVRGV